MARRVSVKSWTEGGSALVPTSLKLDEYPGLINQRVPYNPAAFSSTKRITFPSSPKYGDKFGIQNVTTSYDYVNLYSAAEKIQDSVTGAVVSAANDIWLGFAGAAFVWEYMPVQGGDAWMLLGLPLEEMLPVRKVDADLIGGSPLQGHAFYMDNGGGRHIQWAKADTATKYRFFGAAMHGWDGTGPPGTTYGLIKFDGMVVIPSGLHEGGAWATEDFIWLSAATLGKYTKTPPTTVSHYIVPIGRVFDVSGGNAYVAIEKGEITEIT
jgi:hypothetical protein